MFDFVTTSVSHVCHSACTTARWLNKLRVLPAVMVRMVLATGIENFWVPTCVPGYGFKAMAANYQKSE